MTIPPGGVLTDINFSLSLASETGSISGTVTSESNGSPLSGLQVDALGANGKLAGTATTNGSGLYTIAGLAGGTSYCVRTRAFSTLINELYPGVSCLGCGAPFTGASPVAVVAGATTGNINFSLASGPGGTISGAVRGIFASGSPTGATGLPFSVVEIYSGTG